MKLSQIKINPDLQLRVNLNKDTIAEYSEALRNGAKFPPMVLFHDGKEYHLVDGNHRYFAYKDAGIEIVDAKVIEGTYRQALEYAFGVNNDHGLRLTAADKRKKILRAFDDIEWVDYSDRQIASMCKVSRDLVSRVRSELGKPKPEAVKFMRDGKEHTMKLSKKEEDEPVAEARPAEEDKLHELAVEIQSLAEENERLEARVAVAAMEGTVTEKGAAQAIIEELQATVKNQEIAIRSLTISRDTFQNKCGELMKQVTYWKKQAQKMAA